MADLRQSPQTVPFAGEPMRSAVRYQPRRDPNRDLRTAAVHVLQTYSADRASELMPILRRLEQMCRQDTGVNGTQGAAEVSPHPSGASGGSNGDSALVPLSRVVKQHIISVYEAMGHNKTRAARVLEIDIKTLYNKLKRYGRQ